MSDRTTVYISGPMTGKPELNKWAFKGAERLLSTQGFTVLNLHNFPATGSYKEALQLDLEMIAMSADAVALLPGWQHSPGARQELRTALDLGLKVMVL